MTCFATLRSASRALTLIGAAASAWLLAGASSLAQDAAPAPAPTHHRKSHGQQAGPAQTPADAQQGAKDPAAAAQHYTDGVKAYQAGKYPATVQGMSAAMATGLASNLVPKALYYRGSAYLQQHEPGLAISDLNSALFVKDGLDDAERGEAKKRRSAAYHEAGLDEPAETPGGGAVHVAGEAATSEPVAKPSSFGDGFTNLFGGLFGGSASSPAQTQPQPPAQPEAPATTAALPSAPSKVSGPQSTGAAEVLPWAATSASGQSPAEPPPQPAAAKPSKAATNKTSAGKGKFHIQVASVPSRAEASGVISTLQSKGDPLASAPVSVDPLKFGTNTYFRVRLGPYATAADTKAPCDALKAAGLDCLVTAH